MTEPAHAMAYETGPFFVEADAMFVPQPVTGGPWDAGLLHGGPVAGLLAHLVESVPSPSPVRICRHTVDMMRGVPMSPLRPEVDVLRAGRRIQVVRASLFDGAVEVARATSLRMRVSEAVNPLDPVRTAHSEDEPHPMPSQPSLLSVTDVGVPAFLRAVEFRREGEFRSGAPGLVWMRMHNTMVVGHDTSPFVRLSTMADMTSMAAQYLDHEEWTTINADLNVTAFRDPVGDWIGIRGLHKNDGDGIGLSEAVLYDLGGRVGRATASILIESR